LNGAPRAGKSSIVAAIQDAFDGPWMNLGVDQARQITPPRYQPGIGLRPGEADHEAAPFVSVFYDLEVDTSVLSPEECADAIRRRLRGPPTSAFRQLAKRRAGAAREPSPGESVGPHESREGSP
jgi:chloramphenicol 3-O-phosphotransferase